MTSLFNPVVKQVTLCKWLDAANPIHLHKAIIAISDSLAERGQKQGSDDFLTRSRDKDRLCSMIAQEWARITDLDAEHFPWTEDHVATMWVKFRKTGDDIEERIRKELESQ